jgi:hypothetical protein
VLTNNETTKYYSLCQKPRYEVQNGGYGNIGPYGENVSKRFFSETTWTIEAKLARNNHLKVLLKVWVFYVDRNSKMTTTAGHSFYIGLFFPILFVIFLGYLSIPATNA